ncbi:MAG: sugar-binding protein [Isosphaeraceae bacterium]
MTALVILACLMAPADDLPVVVLIGDSIRMGYEPYVAEALKGKARIVGPGKENGGDSSNVLKNLDRWAIAHKPAIVHFNAGLHDLKRERKAGKAQVELEDYRKNLAEIRKRLEQGTSARLIFATTTPVIDARHQSNKDFDRREDDVKAYNDAAREVLGSGGVMDYDDLHAVAEKLGVESALLKDGVHYTPAAYKGLAASVVASIERALQEPPVTREADCNWADQAPKIDGIADEAVWKKAQVIDKFPAFWKGLDTGKTTRARLLWDDEALYFAAEMTDAELKSFGTKRNDTIWNGDVFELFFKPSADRPEYYEYQVNPKSVILELAIPGRGFNFQEIAAKPPMGFQAVAKVDGTLDRPGDTDKGWSVEGRIPWTIFAPTGGKPKPGDAWSFALCRYDYGPEGTEPVLMSSAPLTRPNFHRYEDYGRLRFVR